MEYVILLRRGWREYGPIIKLGGNAIADFSVEPELRHSSCLSLGQKAETRADLISTG